MDRRVWLVILTFLVVVAILLALALVGYFTGAWDNAGAHDLCVNTKCEGESDMKDGGNCEAVEAEPMTQHGGPSGYFLPASGEFVPASQALPSPDERFHRCTYPKNEVWRSRGSGAGPEGWITVPDNSTFDGKPPTRCFFVPRLVM